MRKSTLEKLREAKKEDFKTEELNGITDLIKFLVSDKENAADRSINPTQLEFILDKSRLKAYKGPAGCAKTTTGCAEILAHALLEPGSRFLVARQNYNDLMTTTLGPMEAMVNRLPEGTLIERSKAAPAKWWIRPAGVRMPDGTIDDRPSMILFMGLTDGLGGYAFDGAMIDEADECDRNRVLEVDTRLRLKNDNHKFLSLFFNPPGTEHWLYEECTGKDKYGDKKKEPTFKLFEPNPKENVKNLDEGYYERLTESLPEDMRQRLVDGEWGSTYPGEAVIRQFSQLLHVSKESLQYAGRTLFRFWDFGYGRPACLWCQVKAQGNVQVMREYLGHHVEGSKFIETVKAKTMEWFPDAKEFMDFGDPAVKQQKDTGSMLSLLNSAGILMRYTYTPFDVSMQVLRKRFESIIDKEPAILLDKRCAVLKGALAGGYHFKKDGVTPEKDGYYDHLVDALRYGIWNIFGTQTTMSSSIPQSIAYWSK